MLIVHPARHARDEIEPARRVHGEQRAGMVERNAEVKNIVVRIESVCPRIDCLRAFQGNELCQPSDPRRVR